MEETVRDRLRRIPTLTGTPLAFETGGDLPADPAALFLRWLDVALEHGVPEPLAMTVATVDAAGRPDARTLILKDVDARGWAFAGPSDSAKGVQLGEHPAAALNFWWQPVVRAIRVRGPVVEADPQEVEADLRARSAAARADIPSGGWRLWRVVPSVVEFWQGSVDRRHVRLVYERDGDGPWRTSAHRG